MTLLAKELLKMVKKPIKEPEVRAPPPSRQMPQAPVEMPRSDDDEIKDVFLRTRPTIKIVGCGGGGSNTITRCVEEGIVGADMFAINTDAQHLLTVHAPTKLLIGRRQTKGLGAGSNPTVGEGAAKENEEEIRNALSTADMVFVTAGMGGGTGTGSAPAVARIAKNLGALTLAIVTTPFPGEGQVRMQNAVWGINKLKQDADTVIVVANTKLLEIVPRLPLNAAFRVADEVLMNSIKGITEMVTKVGLVNLDFNDLKTVMKSGGTAVIGMGDASDSPNKAREAVNDALNSPLLDIDVADATGALVCVFGGRDMTVKEAENVAHEIHDRIGENATIIWGAYIDERLDNTIKVMLVLTGVKLKHAHLENVEGPMGGGFGLDYIK